MRGTARQSEHDATEDVGIESLLCLAFLEGGAGHAKTRLLAMTSLGTGKPYVSAIPVSLEDALGSTSMAKTRRKLVAISTQHTLALYGGAVVDATAAQAPQEIVVPSSPAKKTRAPIPSTCRSDPYQLIPPNQPRDKQRAIIWWCPST